MASGANKWKVLKVHDEIKCSSPVRPLASDVIFGSKLAELHAKKDKNVKLTEISENEHVQERVRSSQPPNSSMANNLAVSRVDISRKAVEVPPSTSKAPKNLTKKPKTGDVHGPAGGLVSSVSSTTQISSPKESKPALKTIPLTQLLGKSQAKSGEISRILVTVNVCGSTGPLRFLVDVKDPVKRVVELALRAYAREGRLPHLGVNCKLVDLYCANSDFEALDPVQPVGSFGTRQFLLHKRTNEEFEHAARKTEHVGSMPWKFMWHMMNSIACSH
ncbi:hypothetical protein O6H91_20G061300 [Diphasiastrum complanatum]|uniref:Uncharacterized protein n=1 Tax=Diphasiastrum complanatum TaxID=34168 RepID=A0ACC2AQY3_DIPCM|nr:hypothetical protein O6H91_20G061300 [Diphasiastrum complanatum]